MRKIILKTLVSLSLMGMLAPVVFAQEVPGELTTVIDRIKTALQALGVAIAAIFIIIGGYQFVTAGGSAEKVEAAKANILWAIIGVAIVFLAEILARTAKWIATGTWS